ncbi:MAG: type I-E CRISPR-associated protein Cas6/Cse3/CasE [Desulfovibrio sp.]|jgi:CRISPR system Cascade subunit CasE|nr:type I-E CRISPR-associated protein Cas6/Cse3/CasE [Desulfovibrio sp.]
MIASRLLLTPRDMLRLRLTDVYSLHRVIYDLFPLPHPESDTVDNKFLFVDNGVKKGIREIVILSRQPPRDCGLHITQREVPDTWLDFPSYRFALTVNPAGRNAKSGKIVALRRREDVVEWFSGKAPSWGFAVSDKDLIVDEVGVWEFTKKNQPVTLGFARLRGLLHVEDRELFRRSFSRGIGRGKAFGCGLLQIVPAR